MATKSSSVRNIFQRRTRSARDEKLLLSSLSPDQTPAGKENPTRQERRRSSVVKALKKALSTPVLVASSNKKGISKHALDVTDRTLTERTTSGPIDLDALDDGLSSQTPSSSSETETPVSSPLRAHPLETWLSGASGLPQGVETAVEYGREGAEAETEEVDQGDENEAKAEEEETVVKVLLDEVMSEVSKQDQEEEQDDDVKELQEVMNELVKEFEEQVNNDDDDNATTQEETVQVETVHEDAVKMDENDEVWELLERTEVEKEQQEPNDYSGFILSDELELDNSNYGCEVVEIPCVSATRRVSFSEVNTFINNDAVDNHGLKDSQQKETRFSWMRIVAFWIVVAVVCYHLAVSLGAIPAIHMDLGDVPLSTARLVETFLSATSQEVQTPPPAGIIKKVVRAVRKR